ncbi:MAG TPA: hypothetical protein VFQ80_16165, partial [Thermomicrobiales bacterium]|nr:hypothetical protein [Thermomicrobiales bacterium]
MRAIVHAVVGADVNFPDIEFTSFGTFGGAMSPNFRIPLVGVTRDGRLRLFTDDEIAAILIHLREPMGQEATAASRFRPLPEGADWIDADTFGLTFEGRAPTQEQVLDFHRRLDALMGLEPGRSIPSNFVRKGPHAVLQLHPFPKPDPELMRQAGDAAFGDLPYDIDA